MKISSINLYNSFNLKPNSKIQPLFCGLKKDVFEKNSQPSFLGIPFGMDDSTKETMLNMSEADRENKIIEVVCFIKAAARESYEMAKTTETMLNKKYGENNWVFVSIGTSPAGIGKALELRGHDVRYMPISGIRTMNDDTYKEYSNPDNHSTYIKFLDSIGLRKDKINNSDKHYIFADFAHKGTTLKYLKKFGYQNGLKKKNAHFIKLNDELEKYTKKDAELNKKVKDYFNFYCLTQQIEHYAAIPHVSYKNTSSIENELNNPSLQGACARGFEVALCYYHIKDKESKIKLMN